MLFRSDITPFLEYFLSGMKEAFGKVKDRANESNLPGQVDHSIQIRDLDHQQRMVLTLFTKNKYLRTIDIANGLDIPTRSVNKLCNKWIGQGFLEVYDPSRKSRSYRLSERYENLVITSI